MYNITNINKTHMRESLITYSDGTKNVCLCIIVSIVLIFLFMISPLKHYFFTSMLGKTIVIGLLCYALYKNIQITYDFSKNTPFSGQWNDIKTNILCSYTFSFFIVVLLFTLLRKFHF